MQTELSILIGRTGTDCYICQSVFDRGNARGCVTGIIVRPVCAEEYEWASDPENVAERYHDYWRETANECADACCEECHGCPDSDKGCGRCGVESLDVLVDRAIRVDGIKHLMFDGSYNNEASRIFDDLGIEHKYTDCVGCGRIFHDLDFDEVYNREALAEILAYEGGAVSYEHAVSVLSAF